jgi:polyisoprenoid-binding protein YceI
MTTERWEIDGSHSGIQFSVRHMVVAKVRGQFSRWSGTILVPEGDLARASVRVVIDATSIETGVAERDAHLKSADFFAVESHPEIVFTGDRVEVEGRDRLKVVGELTLHGVTREVTLEVEAAGTTRDPWGNVRQGFAAKASINRADFGLTWNQVLETGGVLVSERVDLEFDIEAVKQAATKVA